MTKTPDQPWTKARKGKRSPGAAAKPAAATSLRAIKKAESRAAKFGRSQRSERSDAAAAVKQASKATRKRVAAKHAKKSVAGPVRSELETAETPVVIRPTDGESGVAVPDAAVPKTIKKSRKGATVRRLPRQTFLIAATLADHEDSPQLGVYAVVTRTPGEALSAVSALLGADVPVGLTGKLSRRMARALGLKPGEVHRI